MASRAARIRTDHAVSIHSSVRPAGEGRPADPPDALARFCAVSDGAHPAEDEYSPGAYRSRSRLDRLVQPGCDEARPGLDRRRASPVQDQSSGRATVLPGHLFPAERIDGLAEGADRKSKLDLSCDPRIVHKLARIG